MPKIPVVSVIDDDESVRISIGALVRSLGRVAYAFASAEDFLRSAEAEATDCLITDIQMPGMSGLELQATLAEENQRIPIIFITAFGDARTRAQAMRSGAVEFLEKPFDDDVLLGSIRSALER